MAEKDRTEQAYFDADADFVRGYGDYLGGEPLRSNEAPQWIAGWRAAKEESTEG